MPSRKSEVFQINDFAVGASYTREQIALLARVAPLVNSREWTGIVEFANCVVLFSTLDKSDLPAEHNYADLFVVDQFKWESQNRNSQQTPVIVKITTSDVPVLLFCRISPKNQQGETLPFIYVGRLAAVTASSNNPVEVLFDLLDYQQLSNPALAQIYTWRPSGSPTRTLDPVELPADIPPRRSGQGRQMDSRKRIAVEQWAMKRCRELYEADGYELTDTSKGKPFDYEAQKNLLMRRIEVKGTTGDLGKVLLTIGEVEAARCVGVPTDLFILHGVQIIEVGVGNFEASSGVVHKISNWIPEDEKLRAIAFEYSVT